MCRPLLSRLDASEDDAVRQSAWEEVNGVSQLRDDVGVAAVVPGFELDLSRCMGGAAVSNDRVRRVEAIAAVVLEAERRASFDAATREVERATVVAQAQSDRPRPARVG